MTMPSPTRLTCAVALSALCAATPALSGELTPIEQHPVKTFNFEGANTLQQRKLRLWVASSQLSPSVDTPGTGKQIYMGGGDYGLTDHLSVGLSIQHFDDQGFTAFDSGQEMVIMKTRALSAKYRFVNTDRLSAALQASVESHQMDVAIPETDEYVTIGAIAAPITYKASEALQFHALPSVAFFPEDHNGSEFFGTITSLGAGLSWKPSDRWLGFASVNAPISGDNVINKDRSLGQKAVYTLGGRFNVNPDLAVNLFATNGMGITPATRILPTVPGGEETLYGASLTYTPSRQADARIAYRRLTGEPRSPRQIQTQQDGLLLASADVIAPRQIAGRVWGGSDDAYGAQVYYGLSYDAQAAFGFEQTASDASVTADEIPSDDLRGSVQFKLRMMDQANGSPLSAALVVGAGRETSSDLIGTLYAEIPVTYQVNDALTFGASAKFAAFGENEHLGAGLGANWAMNDTFSVLAEAVQTDNDDNATLWALGTRAHLGQSPFSMDLSASNAVGGFGIGTLIAQDDPKYTLSVRAEF